MKERLLEYLVCPSCQGNLLADEIEREYEEILSGTLVCLSCKKSFPIVRGIPRFVGIEMLPKKVADTSRAFAYEWRTFSRLAEYYREQFLDWIAPIAPAFFPGKTVLDAGCGKGRHLVWVSQFGAREVIGVDLSEAIEIAYRHTKHLPNVHVIQADLLELPLKKESFDYVYSVGVIHHLPEPQQGFKELVSFLKPAGHISIWVYGREGNGWLVWIVNPIQRLILSRVPARLLEALSWPLAGLLSLLARATRYLRLPYRAYLRWVAQFPFFELHAIVFDHLAPRIVHYLRGEEIERWFQEASLEKFTLSWRNRNSWRATGVKRQVTRDRGQATGDK